MIRWLTFLSLTACLQAATTFTLRPDATSANSGDAYLRATAATTNFGGAGALVVSGSGAANTKGAYASVLKFDLSLATSAFDLTYGTGNWVLQSLQIELTSVVPNNTNFNTNAAGTVKVDWLTVDSWIESGAGSITWSGLPALTSGGSESLGTLAYNGGLATTQYSLNGSSGFISDLTSGGIATIYLNATSDPNVSLVMNSRNFGTPETRPALILTASPEPARSLLFLLGLSMILARRVRIVPSHAA